LQTGWNAVKRGRELGPLESHALASSRPPPGGCTLVRAGFGRSQGPYKMGNSPKIPPEVSSKLRSLAHDLSNAIETVMQAGYLLGQAKLDGDTKKWVALIDTASRDAARINREIRDILRANSE